MCTEDDSPIEMSEELGLAFAVHVMLALHSSMIAVLLTGSPIKMFGDFKPVLQYCCITMPNGKPTQIKLAGLVHIGPNLFLKDVLHVSTFTSIFC